MHRKEILETGIALTTGDRNKTYGSPYKNHEDIAKGWSVILGIEIQPWQVANCMAWLKIARTIKKPDHMDNYIDGAVYMAIAGELAAEEAAKEQVFVDEMIDNVLERTVWPDRTEVVWPDGIEGDGASIESPAVTFGR
jgi:hypothetical protein